MIPNCRFICSHCCFCLKDKETSPITINDRIAGRRRLRLSLRRLLLAVVCWHLLLLPSRDVDNGCQGQLGQQASSAIDKGNNGSSARIIKDEPQLNLLSFSSSVLLRVFGWLLFVNICHRICCCCHPWRTRCCLCPQKGARHCCCPLQGCPPQHTCCCHCCQGAHHHLRPWHTQRCHCPQNSHHRCHCPWHTHCRLCHWHTCHHCPWCIRH